MSPIITFVLLFSDKISGVKRDGWGSFFTLSEYFIDLILLSLPILFVYIVNDRLCYTLYIINI